MWQDIVMSSVFIIFIVTFLPQIYDCYYRKCKMNLFSAGVTVLGLSIVAVCLLTLGTTFSAIMQATVAFEWLLCFYFSWRQTW